MLIMMGNNANNVNYNSNNAHTPNCNEYQCTSCWLWV